MSTHSQSSCHSIRIDSDFFALHGYMQVPHLVQWMATLKCELSCEHCLTVSNEPASPDMPLEKVVALIDEIAEMGVREFLVTGGEPLVREDLPEVIEYLGCKHVNWTLNTAIMPSERMQSAIAMHRPGFVAISLDGPREVHDAFRGKSGAWDEAMESIRFFRSLPGVRVCAGTTVTSRNYRHLEQTFHLAVASGVDQWGIHLLVPEGRAGQREDLFLSKSQLRKLIRFVARKRQYFSIEMADEIGYLGYLEPLVRDVPLTCGAGRSQCVILPDGEVVPCSTLDRSCSAGNIHEQRLKEIWTNGFRELREWRPWGKCEHCDYSPACMAGCWLQRKAGTQCFREVWHLPGALKTAAGVAICLGGLAAYTGEDLLITTAQPKKAMQGIHLHKQVTGNAVSDVNPVYMDNAILSFYAELAAGMETGSLALPLGQACIDEETRILLTGFREGTLPQDMSERCEMVRSVLETQQRSLSMAALLWRVLNEPLFDTDYTGELSESDRQAFRTTLAAVEQKAHEWRVEIFENRLDPYLSSGRLTDPPFFMMSKAGPRPGDYETYALSVDLDEERWGGEYDPDHRETADFYLQDHPYAELMDLVFRFSGPGTVTSYAGGGVVVLDSDIDDDGTGLHSIGIFDVIETLEDVDLTFEIRCSLGADSPFDSRQDDQSGDRGSEEESGATISISIEGGREYTYLELLNAIYQRHRDSLVSITYDWLSRDAGAEVHQNVALLWPPVREIMESDSIIHTAVQNHYSGRVVTAAHILELKKLALLRDIDFWMF